MEVYHKGQIVEQYEGNPLPFIEQFHARYKVPEIPGLPRFIGGLVGYFGYETIYHFEQLAHRLKQPAKADPIGTPDILLMLSEELAVVDNLSGKIHLIVYADPAADEAGYLKARERKPCANSCAKALPCRSRSAAHKPHRSTKPAKRAIKNTCAASANIF